ncbi:tankyrase-2-like [Mizuhopecten yessoensis]|uniref:Ankyrin repeat domain-containing protein 10 n=1 Tax=Mizuhopecten yessoensis TaxID=6573 RepID=A0A210PSS1_MIZYE|nr:tankyrase-2-like [Mizuhopecten yessoensis]XP_021376131.1 tankyrase-2-like [Mizuhopecten yessoensis]OWF39504.1 Ankyrin repeat domain-containing protein 10 [Mizuhopecten yessoensis]
MGGKASSLMWCDPTRSLKGSSYIYSYKLPPPSFHFNWTDLHYAASHGNFSRIQEIIIKSGTVSVNHQDYYGKTPLYWAAYKGYRSCVEELLKCGALVNIHCRHGGTALHAVVGLYPECALLLIQHGADVNQVDNWGVTPMYLAASSGQLEVIRYLLAAGAKPSFRNKKTGDIPKQLDVHKQFCDWLLNLSKNPPSLQQMCRTKVRERLGEPLMIKMDTLNLPTKIKAYISLKNFS